MNKRLLYLIPLSLAFALPAHAQSRSTSLSNSSAGSTAHVGNTSSTLINNGSVIPTSTTIHNTPDTLVPSISGGNPCTVGAALGGSVAGFGIAGGTSWADAGCERRQNAALLFNIGHHEAALALLCATTDVANGLHAAGERCPQDNPAAVEVVVLPEPPAPPTHRRPDRCDTRSPKAPTTACN